MLCYFDRLQRQMMFPPRKFPIVSAWTKDMIKARATMEVKYGFGKGNVLPRIQAPEEPLPHQQELPQPSAHHQQPPQRQPQHQRHHNQPTEDVHPSDFQDVKQKIKDHMKTIAYNFQQLNSLLKKADHLFPNNSLKGNMKNILMLTWDKRSGSHHQATECQRETQFEA